MARIKIKNLAKNVKISKEEMRGVAGGYDAILGRIVVPSPPDVVIEPVGRLDIHQHAVPLNIEIEHIGTKDTTKDPTDPPTLEKVPSTLKT